MTTEITFLADLHLKAIDPLSSTHYDRLDEKFEVLEKAIYNSTDYLILGGDIFNNLDPPDWLRARLIQTLKLANKETQIYILLGNHETNLRNHAYESIKAFGLKRFKVIDEPQYFSTSGVYLHFVPYNSFDNVVDTITDIKRDKPVILFGHWDMEGAISSGKSEYKISTLLRPHHLDNYLMTFLGHIHNRQTSKNQRWSFVGSPIYQTFGEIDDASKGFNKITLDKENISNIEFIPSGCAKPAQITYYEEEEPLSTTDSFDGKIIKVVFSGNKSFIISDFVKEKRTLWKRKEDHKEILKVIFDIEITNNDLAQDSPEQTSATDLSHTMEKLCNEKKKEALLPDGLLMIDEARNEISQN